MLAACAAKSSPNPCTDGGDCAAAAAAAPATQATAAIFPFYDSSPTWRSSEKDLYETGIALADIDNDGRTDIVVSSGNDMRSQTISVFFNHVGEAGARGPFGVDGKPEWTATEAPAFYHHVSAGDVDQDGCIDVAVSVAIVLDGTGTQQAGGVRVFFNRGRVPGTDRCFGLESKPSYVGEMGLGTISCALADVDGDGDLDLAVSVYAEAPDPVESFHSEAFTPVVPFATIFAVPPGSAPQPEAVAPSAPRYPPARARIFLNHRGVLEKTASWKGEPKLSAADIAVADIDQDGLMDLALAAPRTTVYFGALTASGRPAITKVPGWQGKEGGEFSYSVDTGRVPGSHTLAVAASFNPNQWDGPVPLYPFVLYLPSRDGSRDEPVWRSDDKGRGSRLAFADLDRDGSVDLITGRWAEVIRYDGSPIRIYRGKAVGHLSPQAEQIAGYSPVGQTLAMANLFHPPTPARWRFEVPREFAGRSVLTMDEANVDRVVRVVKNGKPLGRREFACVPGSNWISVAVPMAVGDVFEVEYARGDRPDLVVADWKPDGPLSVFAYREP